MSRGTANQGSWTPEGHLKGRGIIAKVFGVSKNTVTLWKEMDAPIYQIGRSLQANYIELWAWLIKMHCQSENMSTPLIGPGRGPDEARTGFLA